MSAIPVPERSGYRIRVQQVDYADPAQAAALVYLLDAYASDPMGGGEPLSDYAKANLVPQLAARSHAFSVLAFAVDATGHETPVGLVNCLEGFSTFACKPLVNVHDVGVLADWRGMGVAHHMLDLVEAIAQDRGACKLTLEVLSGNSGAVRAYERFGFAYYALDPALGTAGFMQKWLAS
ncbi:N-acetyltransferase [Curvibacter sp. CHRR-16]|uniref:GNAT family N-acetyltransferase n=1 Tax=Curvibacter sp. CHRR-16 TaxID=2835872 RepID=UPI001BDA59FB|nr:GNAT family N-acetyltransferase [Curvibacter sp. CHRR-16]MBT0570839.1 N-acetyltransferase [Curvibacter sp. CHRR-16]